MEVVGQLGGIAASPGVVTGIARVVLKEDQFGEVEPGNILVSQTTNPAWVTVFTKIVGVVTDAGGTVSDPAVTAREFGIPAVVGTAVATKLIKSGDRIRVNGTTGLVEILERAAEPEDNLRRVPSSSPPMLSGQASGRVGARQRDPSGHSEQPRRGLKSLAVGEGRSTPAIRPDRHGALAVVVDDEPSVRTFCRKVLVMAGFAVETLGDGASAVERRFRDPVPAVIVMNWVMPVMDGVEAVRLIRAREAAEAWPRMPIVLESGSIIRAVATNPDVDGTLSKPFDFDDIINAVGRVMRVVGRIDGIAASPGLVEGTARVVLTEDQLDQVKAGDILVCQMSNPAWFVEFTKIVGLVTDAGGTLSDPAELAREFHIPAVVGTAVATQQIKSGDRIFVNGSTGQVEIIERASQPE